MDVQRLLLCEHLENILCRHCAGEESELSVFLAVPTCALRKALPFCYPK